MSEPAALSLAELQAGLLETKRFALQIASAVSDVLERVEKIPPGTELYTAPAARAFSDLLPSLRKAITGLTMTADGMDLVVKANAGRGT
jgi:hypothetical protein